MKLETVYKVAVSVPEDFLEKVMNAVTEAIEPLYPGYDRVFSHWPVTGTWRPLPGSHPYDGIVGRISVEPEVHLEFAVRGEYLYDAVEAVRNAHPYEEPAIDIIPMVAWKSVTPSDGI